VLLVCTDGLWGSLQDAEIAAELGAAGTLREQLLTLGERAVKRAGGTSDNTSAAALRWLGE
jgi:PPM family protein phosphatase